MAFYDEFAGHYEAIFPFRPATAALLERWLPATGPLLDVGCGTGDACAHLQGPDRPCTGIDPDGGMIERARARHPGPDFRVLGMEGIGDLPAGTWAGVSCLGNVLPHVPAAAQAEFLAGVHRLLRPGGIWFLQTVNFDPLLAKKSHTLPPVHREEGSLVFHREYRDIGPDRLVFHTRLEEGGRTLFSGETDLHPRTHDQWLRAHRDAGFRPLFQGGGWDGKPYDPDHSPGWVGVWERP